MQTWTLVAALAAAAGGASAQLSTISFDVDGAGNALTAGTGFTGNEYAALGVTISSMNPNMNPLNLFDTDARPSTGGDPDLQTGAEFDTDPQGNVLIIQDIGDNPISTPDDDEDGGGFLFEFSNPLGVAALSIGILDLDENVDPIFTFTFLNGLEIDGSTLLVDVDLVNEDFPGDNSLRVYSFSAAVPLQSLEIELDDVSGAITFVEFTNLVPTPGSMMLFAAAGLSAARRRRA
ncbi:MAG: PEP-CTERM sorting domain-containing protein [Planctomycetota bacterium]